MSKGKLRSWLVRVRDPHAYKPYQRRTHYVVARTKASAIRQAKVMSGYSDCTTAAGVQDCSVLEELE